MIQKICNVFIAIILVAVLGVLTVLAIPFFRGDKIYAVLTESMEPTYPVGSLVVVEPVDPQEVEVGDAITFQAGGFSTLATHRVIEKLPETQEFITKGDNNEYQDFTPISYNDVVGRVRYGIPYLGTAVMSLKTAKGILMATGVVVVIVILLVLPELFKKDPEHE